MRHALLSFFPAPWALLVSPRWQATPSLSLLHLPCSCAVLASCRVYGHVATSIQGEAASPEAEGEAAGTAASPTRRGGLAATTAGEDEPAADVEVAAAADEEEVEHEPSDLDAATDEEVGSRSPLSCNIFSSVRTFHSRCDQPGKWTAMDAVAAAASRH